MSRGKSGPSQITRAALSLFATKGVQGTSLQMIADDLGVTKAAVYHHFQTKQAIIEAVLAPALTDLQQLVDESSAIPDPSERIRILVEGLAEGAIQHRDVYSVVLRDVAATTVGAQELWDSLHALLAADRVDVETRVRVAMFLSGLVAPAVDSYVSQMSDEDIRAGIIEVGRSLEFPEGRQASH